jgi:hypothetical protein
VNIEEEIFKKIKIQKTTEKNIFQKEEKKTKENRIPEMEMITPIIKKKKEIKEIQSLEEEEEFKTPENDEKEENKFKNSIFTPKHSITNKKTLNKLGLELNYFLSMNQPNLNDSIISTNINEEEEEEVIIKNEKEKMKIEEEEEFKIKKMKQNKFHTTTIPKKKEKKRIFIDFESDNEESMNKSKYNEEETMKIEEEEEEEETYDEKLIEEYNELLKIMKGYKSLLKYECKKGINILKKLNEHNKNTSFVLNLIGKGFFHLIFKNKKKGYFEMNNYIESEKYFKKILKYEPYKIEGLEIYRYFYYTIK